MGYSFPFLPSVISVIPFLPSVIPFLPSVLPSVIPSVISVLPTRKMSTIDLIASDPILSAMAKGDIPWGDLLISHEETATPVLKTRKDIWTTFPVKLIPLGTGDDGAERHAIAWDYTRFRSGNWLDYERSTRERLYRGLEASKKWVVEPATPRNDYICVIRMVFEGYQPTELCNQGPALTTLADIYNFFPAVTYKMSNNTHSIELHSKRLKKMSEIKGYDVTCEVEQELISALKASIRWRVLVAKLPCELCRIEML